jgi:hypothetical protein
MENPDVQQMLESASPIGHHIRCHNWTAYAETKRRFHVVLRIKQHRLLAENLETAHAIGPETMTCLLLLPVLTAYTVHCTVGLSGQGKVVKLLQYRKKF